MAKEEYTAGDAVAEEAGGAGGKLRSKRSSRRQATPYDRPPPRHRPPSPSSAAQNAPDRPTGGSWFSKLVADPASRLLVGGTTRLLSSVFSKRAHALPQPQSDVTGEGKLDDSAVVCEDVQCRPTEDEDFNEEIKKDFASTSHGHGEGSDGNWLAEFEHLMKQKTLSRDEFNRFSAFLRLRTIDPPQGDIHKSENATMIQRAELSLGNSGLPEVDIHKSKNATIRREIEPPQANSRLMIPLEMPKATTNAGVVMSGSTPLVPSLVLDDSYASPAEIAKAYMSRTSVYGPVSQSRIFNVEKSALAPKPVTPKMSRFSLAPKSPACWPGAMRQEDHSYFTPQSRRSSIGLHKMARTHYAKSFQPSSGEKVTGEGPSTRFVQWEPSATPLTGGSQALKRRSLLADNAYESVGPIRRVRQKSIMMNPLEESSSLLPAGSTPLFSGSYTGRSSRPTYKAEKMENGGHESSLLNFPVVDGKTEKSGVTSHFVPSEIDISAKISKHLGRMFPSPKSKSVEISGSGTGDAATSTIITKNREDLASDLTRKYVHSESPRPLIGQAASVTENIWKGSNHLQALPEIAKANKDIGSRNASIPVSESVSSGITINHGIEFEARKPLNLDKHCFQSFTHEVSVKQDNHKDEQTSQLELTGTKAEEYLPFLGKSNTVNQVTSSKTGEKFSTPDVDESGFTFPISSAPAMICEPPPTPTITPLVVPSFSFGLNCVGKNLVFSFDSSSTADVSTTIPQFKFGTGEDKLSFSSAVAALTTLPSSQSTVFGSQERTGNEGKSSSETSLMFPKLPAPTAALGSDNSSANKAFGAFASGSSPVFPSFFPSAAKNVSLTPSPFQFSSFQSGSSTSTNNNAQAGAVPTPLFPFGSTTSSQVTFEGSSAPAFGSTRPAFSFSSAQNASNSALFGSKTSGPLGIASSPSIFSNEQVNKEINNTQTSVSAPRLFNTQSSSGLESSAVPVFQFSSPAPSGQGLPEGASPLASGDQIGRRFIKINRDKIRRR